MTAARRPARIKLQPSTFRPVLLFMTLPELDMLRPLREHLARVTGAPVSLADAIRAAIRELHGRVVAEASHGV